VYDQVEEDPYAAASKDPTKAFTGVVNENFPKMRNWILEHLQTTANDG